MQMGVSERDLFSAVLLRAMDDCAMIGSDAEGREAKVDAYRWIADRHKWFLGYCLALDLDPEAFRERVLAKYGARCEELIHGMAKAKAAKQARKDARIAKAEAYAAKKAAWAAVKATRLAA